LKISAQHAEIRPHAVDLPTGEVVGAQPISMAKAVGI
jgi:hypothetical protein